MTRWGIFLGATFRFLCFWTGREARSSLSPAVSTPYMRQDRLSDFDNEPKVARAVGEVRTDVMT